MATSTKKSTTKSAAKKATAKKPTKKASTKKSTKKKVFSVLPNDKKFHLLNGQVVNDYLELADSLEQLEDHVIEHHITEVHNDFASWIKEVFDDEELAKKVAEAHAPKAIRLVIYKHLVDKHLK